MARDDPVVMCDMARIGVVKGDVAMDAQKSIGILVDVVNGSDAPCIASGKVVSLTTKF
jgi:methyl coenzyme M reductase subunit C